MREYRLKWKREGRDWAYRIYQSAASVIRKYDGILALEEVKGDSPRWESLPDLVAIEIEAREVGEWGQSDLSLDRPVSEWTRDRVGEWAGVHEGYPATPSSEDASLLFATGADDIPF